MRSNGLTAPAYSPVADLDPRVADALLDDLKSQGIAAYTSPVESSTTVGLDGPEFRDHVRERLYVDAAASAQVRELLSQQDPSMLQDNEDLTWAQIVAGFDQPLEGKVAPWPVSEEIDPPSKAPSARDGLDTSGETGSEYADERADDDPAQAGHGHHRDGLGRGPAAKLRAQYDDDEDRFVPPPPPPLPHLDGTRQAAWVAVLGGPLLLLTSVLFSIALPGWLALLSALGFIGGFVALVVTMPNDSDADDPDHGAVV
jgi:hypothetical protein